MSNSELREGKTRSDEIDKQIEEDSKKFKRECKILLLGESFCSLPRHSVHLEGGCVRDGRRISLGPCSGYLDRLLRSARTGPFHPAPLVN